MHLKKLLALLLSAALALSVFAGCGQGQQSVAQALLDLLDGKYANVSVEMDPDLEADLRQAIRTAESENAGDDEAVIRAALETLLGSTVTFRKLGEGQQGDTTFDLVFCAGSDPDKAAQAGYAQWNGTFSTLPDDGKYTAGLAQVQTENGVWLLVKGTVDKAGTVDKPDREPEPEKGYTEEKDQNGNVTGYTVNTKGGLQELFNDKTGSDFTGITITLEALENNEAYTITKSLAKSFSGTLKSKDEKSKAKINLSGGSGLFNEIGTGGQVLNVDITVTSSISIDATDGNDDANIGAVAGINNGGTITGCDVTISNTSIRANAGSGNANAGGIVAQNKTGGQISSCEVIVENRGSISATKSDGNSSNTGGIAGDNRGNITNCKVTVRSGGSIEAIGKEGTYGCSNADAGGIAGVIGSSDTITACSVTLEVGCTITASTSDSGRLPFAGGIVGHMEANSDQLSYGATGGGSIIAKAGESDLVSVTAELESKPMRKGNACASASWGTEAYHKLKP